MDCCTSCCCFMCKVIREWYPLRHLINQFLLICSHILFTVALDGNNISPENSSCLSFMRISRAHSLLWRLSALCWISGDLLHTTHQTHGDLGKFRHYSWLKNGKRHRVLTVCYKAELLVYGETQTMQRYCFLTVSNSEPMKDSFTVLFSKLWKIFSPHPF